MIISIATIAKATRYSGFDYCMCVAVRLTSGVIVSRDCAENVQCFRNIELNSDADAT